MSPLSRLAGLLALCAAGLKADSSLAPTLQWVQGLGGSGANQVNAAVADSHGNLYLAGSTSSLDFPVTSAAQPNPGGSALYRINSASGASQKLYPPGLSAPTSLAVDPANPKTLYATAANAVWRTTDAGATWASLPALGSATTVNFVAVDPLNGSTLYAATSPQGVLKSTDGGQTWTATPSGPNAFRLWADPKTPQVVFASTDNGLERSFNGGASWTTVITAYYSPESLAFDPFTAGTIYLGTGAGYAIGKSTDDGQTFSPISALPYNSVANVLIADPLHAGVLYAGSYGPIYQSSDFGVTWTQTASGEASVMAADPLNPVLYANLGPYGIVRSSDGFHTSTTFGPPETSVLEIAVAGPSVFVLTQPSTDAFVAKLDPNGNLVYSTYFGGSAGDSAAAIALGGDGSVYVAGTTGSIDFPTTPGAYSTALKTTSYAPSSSNFVLKLNPDGSLAWSTYFADGATQVAAIAVDAAGNPYISGTTPGGLPTTAGAYQSDFQQTCTPTFLIGCIPGPTSAFVTKFNPNGSGLIYSTYVPVDSNKATIQGSSALLADAAGNVYLSGAGNVLLLNAAGSALFASTSQTHASIAALARDAAGNVYAAGTNANAGFFTTAGAFQTTPQPAFPSLPGEAGAGGGSDAFVMKWDAGLSQLLASTLLGGELTDTAESIAIDSAGNVIVSGSTDSKAFPTRVPFQAAFSSHSGFVAAFDSSLSQLIFSTYLGDTRAFDAHVAVPDGSGNILLAGSTLNNPGTLFVGGEPGLSYTNGSLIVANKIALPPAGAARLDSVLNIASRYAAPLAPGETFAAVGSAFGADAQLLVDGSPLPLLSQTATTLTAAMPDSAKTSGAFTLQVATGGVLSNPVLVPAAPASPGLFSLDGTGFGQGYILNADGTQNSPANPAAPGSAITIFVTGAGPYTLSDSYAVTALFPYVFVDGFFADGIAATIGPVAGLPGNVYQLGAYVPDPATLVAYNPNLKDFKMPPQVGVRLVFGAVNPSNPDNSAIISQPGLVLNVTQ